MSTPTEFESLCLMKNSRSSKSSGYMCQRETTELNEYKTVHVNSCRGQRSEVKRSHSRTKCRTEGGRREKSSSTASVFTRQKSENNKWLHRNVFYHRPQISLYVTTDSVQPASSSSSSSSVQQEKVRNKLKNCDIIIKPLD